MFSAQVNFSVFWLIEKIEGTAEQKVGAGLPAIAVCQSMHC